MIVKNLDNKTVCIVDEETQTVEIVKKRCKTEISFDKNGKADIKNTKIKGEK